MRRLKYSLLLIIIIGVMTACSNNSTKIDYFANANDEVVSIYNKGTCIACHASDLRGHVGESTNLQKVGARLNKEEIMEVIRDGRGQMPPQSPNLTEEQIEQLADWLITLK